MTAMEKFEDWKWHSWLDVADFLCREKEKLAEVGILSTYGGDRKSKNRKENKDATITFAIYAAEKMNTSRSSIDRFIARGKKIVPEAKSIISNTWLANNGTNLDAMTKLSKEDQLRVAALIRNRPEIRSVKAALEALAQ